MPIPRGFGERNDHQKSRCLKGRIGCPAGLGMMEHCPSVPLYHEVCFRFNKVFDQASSGGFALLALQIFLIIIKTHRAGGSCRSLTPKELVFAMVIPIHQPLDYDV